MSEYRVLLVDDEEELVSTLVERLSYRGFVSEYATNGAAALKMLREQHFDVVVIDLKLPGMSGEQLVHTIGMAYPNLPVLMVTGHGSGDSGPGEKPAGVHELLLKPLDISELVNKMNDAIGAHADRQK